MSEASASAHALDHHEPVTSTGIPNKKVLMWAFLGSDCMFFGTLISTHLIYRKISATVGGNFLDIRDVFDIELIKRLFLSTNHCYTFYVLCFSNATLVYATIQHHLHRQSEHKTKTKQ